MLHIYLDSALFAVPNYAYGTNALQVQELIDRVFHFSDILTAGLPLRLVVADEVEGILGVDYPTPESIRDFLTEENLLHYYSVNDLYEQYLTILDRACRASDLGHFEVCEASSFTSSPGLPAGLGPAGLLSETQRCVTTVAVQADEHRAWLLGSSMNDDGTRSLDVTATVEGASQDSSVIYGPVPFTFTRTAEILVNFSALVEFASARELWCRSSSAEDVYLAVALGGLALRRGMYPAASIGDLKSFAIGSEFMASLGWHQCGRGQNFSLTTFELCAQIVADIGIATYHPMGAPHQRRAADNAGAFRSHITSGNPSLRLMFWETATGFEFSNVGNKKALKIEPGRIEGAVSLELGALL